jgi:hypothetical protein
MGGIPTNYHGEVVTKRNGRIETVPGLMAIGEAACVSVHGANRLGSNSLLDLVVFGRAAAKRAAETTRSGEAHKPLPASAADPALARFDRLRNAKGAAATARLRADMQRVMQNNCAVFRSADVLEALGIPVDLSPEAAARAIEEAHFAFLFAPRFHPAFKGIAPVRALCAERGQRTVFNRLGPLLNPARPSAQLLGVSRTEWVEPMARTLQALGLRRGMVVSGEVPGHGTLDELSTLGTNYVAEFYQDRGFSASSGSASDFPLIPATLADLTDPAYRDLLVVQNPASSSPGLAFLLATVASVWLVG